MFTHSIPTIPWTKCLGLSGETTMTEQQQSTSHKPEYVPFWVVFMGLAASVGLAFTTVGLVNDWGGMRTKPIGFFVRYAQGTARLVHFWPSTADARGGCQALGGVNTWSPAGLTVHTLEGGYCSYMRPLEASYLYTSHDGSTVEHSFPGRELPDPIRR